MKNEYLKLALENLEKVSVRELEIEEDSAYDTWITNDNDDLFSRSNDEEYYYLVKALLKYREHQERKKEYDKCK
jgi:hypothetical protein